MDVVSKDTLSSASVHLSPFQSPLDHSDYFMENLHLQLLSLMHL